MKAEVTTAKPEFTPGANHHAGDHAMKVAFKAHDDSSPYGDLHVGAMVPCMGYAHQGRGENKYESEGGRRLRLLLIDVPGVEEAGNGAEPSYEIRLKRGGAFSWEEILPEVFVVIREFFDCNELEVVEPYR